jgi:hypothetical protein
VRAIGISSFATLGVYHKKASLLHNDLYIAPPLWAKKIGVRPGLEAHRRDARLGHARDLLADQRLWLAALPQEPQEAFGSLAVQHVVEA